MDRKCPKCGSENAHDRAGTLYADCWSCNYAWVPGPAEPCIFCDGLTHDKRTLHFARHA